MRSFRFGVGVVAAVTAAQMLAPATVAHASTGVVVFAGSNKVSIVASPGVANRITVNYSGGLLFVSDPADTVTNSGGCTNGPNNTLQCPVAEFFTLSIDAGNLNDRIVVNANLEAHVSGGPGDDIITVGPGNTKFANLHGGLDNDHLEGGGGNDTLDGGPGADLLHGGTGTDTASYVDSAVGVTVDIDGVADDGAIGEGDNVLTSIENVSGSAGNDTLTGNNLANILSGGNGHDVLNGLGADDVLNGGQGNDSMSGGPGNDLHLADIVAELDGADMFSGGDGTDTAGYSVRLSVQNISLDGVANDGSAGEGDNIHADVENATTGFGSDTITGNASANSLRGGFGSDTLNGLDGDDVLIGDNDNDTLSGGVGVDSLDGGEGNDSLIGGTGNDSLMGGPGLTAGPDPIIRDTDVLNGGSGVDTVSFAGRTLGVVADIDGTPDDGVAQENDNILSNVENIIGGEGNDTLTGNILANTLRGGNGNDILDVLDGLDGNDTADGMTGNDTCVIDDGDASVNCEQ